MKFVDPDTITTLLLGPDWLPFGVATARGAFYSLLKDKGTGLDADGNPYRWDQYVSRNISVFPDQPTMRSGNNPAYTDNLWPIPTVFVVNSKFFFKRKRANKGDSLPSLREVYDAYDQKCAFCFNRVKFCDASREHIFSRAYGTNNHESNIALACKRCNSLAGHAMPKLDINGNEIEGKVKVKPAHYVLPSSIKARPDWAPYLFLS